MNGKYIFKGQDITTDILFKIEQIASIMAEKEHIHFDDAYEAFTSSDTYNILKRTNNLYWAESAEFIADEYYREKTPAAPEGRCTSSGSGNDRDRH